MSQRTIEEVDSDIHEVCNLIRFRRENRHKKAPDEVGRFCGRLFDRHILELLADFAEERRELLGEGEEEARLDALVIGKIRRFAKIPTRVQQAKREQRRRQRKAEAVLRGAA